jgi:hypothetical protein
MPWRLQSPIRFSGCGRRAAVSPRKVIPCKIAVILAASIQGSVFRAAAAQEQSPIIPPICATEEAAVITLIEDHGMADDVAPEKLTAAFEAMLDARAACYGGQTERAVAQYDAILSGLGRLHIGRKE